MSKVTIRAVTAGLPVEYLSKHYLPDEYTSFNRLFVELFGRAGFSIRTQRICLSPVNESGNWEPERTFSIVSTVQKIANRVDIRWICVPFDFTAHDVNTEFSNTPLQILKQHKNCFVNILVAKNKHISLEGVKTAATLIKKVSRLSPNGFDNFRLGVGANCPHNIPFFPFSYNQGGLGFSLAIETLLTATQVIKELGSQYTLDRFKVQFKSIMIEELQHISTIALSIEQETGFEFRGVDISFAPFPGESSIVELMELMGLEVLGGRGTVFITSLLTDVLREVLALANIRCSGFNGVMFSLLEDVGLAKRNNQRMYDIDSMLLYSTVCGCGLDMVPLPGNILEEELSGMILDLASLSINLNKPLGLRVLPIPGADTNDMTSFNYDFLVNTRVKEIKNAGVDMDFMKGSISYQCLRP